MHPDNDAKADFATMENYVELKVSEMADPFCDPDDPLHPQANDFRFERESARPMVVETFAVKYLRMQLLSQASFAHTY